MSCSCRTLRLLQPEQQCVGCMYRHAADTSRLTTPVTKLKTACSNSADLITVTGAGAVGHVHAGASAAAVHRAVKLVDGYGVGAVRVLTALHTSIPGACKQFHQCQCCLSQESMTPEAMPRVAQEYGQA